MEEELGNKKTSKIRIKSSQKPIRTVTTTKLKKTSTGRPRGRPKKVEDRSIQEQITLLEKKMDSIWEAPLYHGWKEFFGINGSRMSKLIGDTEIALVFGVPGVVLFLISVFYFQWVFGQRYSEATGLTQVVYHPTGVGWLFYAINMVDRQGMNYINVLTFLLLCTMGLIGLYVFLGRVMVQRRWTRVPYMLTLWCLVCVLIIFCVGTIYEIGSRTAEIALKSLARLMMQT